jgi:ubiquinone/menaquinone biosynthesis C-methylase UbiE
MTKLYGLFAPLYDLIFRFLYFGIGRRVHRAALRALVVEPGATVVDVGCGTGLLIGELRTKVGPNGRVLGNDPAEAMIDQARERARQGGWTNVDLQCIEMESYVPDTTPDAAVFALSLSTANPDKALHNTIQYLRPGALIVIVDALPVQGRWFHPVVNLYSRLKAPLVGSSLARAAEVAVLVRQHLDDVHMETICAGMYTVITGRTRSPQAS